MSCQKLAAAVAASIAAVSFAVAPAVAAPPVDVPIINASFEDPPLANGTFGLGGVAPWSDFDAFGPLDPPAAYLFDPVPDGENVAFSNLAGGNTAEQIVGVYLCEGDEITLSVYVGARNDALTFGGYIVSLEAVAPDDSRTPLVTKTSADVGATIPAAGRFVELTLSATVLDPSLLGDQQIAIKLGSYAAMGQQTLFDDVELTVHTTTIVVPDCIETIQGAIDYAENGDLILIKEGTYYETLDFQGKAVTVAPYDHYGQVIITRPEIAFTRGVAAPSLVTFVSGEGADTVLEGVILDGAHLDVTMGALVFIEGASPTFREVTFRYGHADLYGGAVYIEKGASHFYDCDFEYNFASLDGGAVYVARQGSPNFYGCDFYENYSEYGGGGAIYVAPFGGLEVFGCEFEYNEALTFGGAICLDTFRQTWVTECYFYENEALVGGAVTSRDGAPMFMYCAFEYNESCGDGGAVFAYDCNMMFKYCYFYENESQFCRDDETRGIEGDVGGGAFAQNFGEASFEYCAFEYNESFGYGGGGAIGVRDVDLEVLDCRFEHNTTYHYGGGGIQAVNGYSSIQRSWFNGNYAAENLRWEGDTVGGGVALWYQGLNVPSGGLAPEPLGLIMSCVFDRNYAEWGGGGIFIYGTGVDVVNCTLYGNETEGEDGQPDTEGFPPFGGGIWVLNTGPFDINIANTILEDNVPDQLFNSAMYERGVGADPIVQYCDIEGGLPVGFNDQGGNIDEYPRFVDKNGTGPWDFDTHDFRLQPNSPCIDAANTPFLEARGGDEFDILLQDRVLDDTGTTDTGVPGALGYVVEMGALEFQGTSDPELGCGPADMAEPTGALDFSDVLAFLTEFAAQDPAVDYAEPFGVFDFSDVFEFLIMFGDGCP